LKGTFAFTSHQTGENVMSVEKQALVLPALNPETVAARTSSAYPEAFKALVAGRSKQALGDVLGLKNFGVNLVKLAPGAYSSLRHWHRRQDEFVYVLEGELTLITDTGEQILGPGMAAGFPAGKPDGHHLINRSQAIAMYLEVGDRLPGDSGSYPDVDLAFEQSSGKAVFTHKDGSPY
jgi:uncharacterized cupin superfamily protein